MLMLGTWSAARLVRLSLVTDNEELRSIHGLLGKRIKKIVTV